MKIFLWAECQKLRRLSLLLLTIFAVCGIAFMVFIGGKSTDYGPPYLEEAGWYMTMTQPWATLLVLPAVIALLGSYMICREAEDDTLKSLLLVPVSETRLTAAKMLLTFVFSILLYLLLFAITFLGEAILHIHALSTNMVLHFLKSYFLEGICVFLAVSPVIALVAYWKKAIGWLWFWPKYTLLPACLQVCPIRSGLFILFPQRWELPVTMRPLALPEYKAVWFCLPAEAFPF